MDHGKADLKLFYHNLFLFFCRHRLSLPANRERSTPEVAEGEGKMPEKPEHGSKVSGDELKCKLNWINFAGGCFWVGSGVIQLETLIWWCNELKFLSKNVIPKPCKVSPKPSSKGKVCEISKKNHPQAVNNTKFCCKARLPGYRHGDGRLMNVQLLINLFLMEIIDNKTISTPWNKL